MLYNCCIVNEWLNLDISTISTDCSKLLYIIGDKFLLVDANNVGTWNKIRPECPKPFYVVGGRCVFIDKDNSGTWKDMRTHCQSLGGDLLKLDSADFMYDIVSYIHINGITFCFHLS